MIPDKSTFRKQLLARRRAISAEEAAAASQALKKYIAAFFSCHPRECGDPGLLAPSVRMPRIPAQGGDDRVVVAGYIPINGELDILPALETMRGRGWTVALPCVEGRNQPLAFRVWQGEALAPGAHGIACPAGDAPSVVPGILLVPLVAFDRNRHRLGYGGGYYDRTIAALRQAVPGLKAYGIAYACQEVDALTPEPHDMRLDAVFTENGVI